MRTIKKPKTMGVKKVSQKKSVKEFLFSERLELLEGSYNLLRSPFMEQLQESR